MPSSKKSRFSPKREGPQKLHVVPKKKIFPYIKPPARELNSFLAIGILLVLTAFMLFSLQGESNWVWLFGIVGVVIAFNAFWLRFDFSTPFIIKYLITMIKTKKFIQFIHNQSHHAKWFQYVCIGGSIFGFGLAGVDYWFGIKVGGWKRAGILFVSAIILGLIFHFFLGILFIVPALMPLYWVAFIGFILLGFGGFYVALLVGYGVLSVGGLFVAKQLCPIIAPVIPGLPIPGLGTPVPAIAWISLVIVLVVHEFSHGIMFSFFKEKIKSVGVLLAGIIPIGAFVEQDDETFNKLDEKKSLLVLSAGSASNLLTIPVVLIFGMLLFAGLQPVISTINNESVKMYSGVQVNLIENTISYCGITMEAPAKGKLLVGDVILKANGVDVNSVVGLREILLQSKGDYAFLVERTDTNTHTKTDLNITITPYTFQQIGIKQIGVDFGLVPTGYQPSLLVYVESEIIVNINVILTFLWLIAFAAGSFNYYPADPFDGGRMAKIMLVPYFGFMGLSRKETQKFIGRFFVWLLLAALLLNLIPYITML